MKRKQKIIDRLQELDEMFEWTPAQAQEAEDLETQLREIEEEE